MKRFFKPEISFDGVAIIAALVGIAMWVGSLKTTVAVNTSAIADHEQRIRTLEHGDLQHSAVAQTETEAQP